MDFRKHHPTMVGDVIDLKPNNHKPISVYEKYRNKDFIELNDNNLDAMIKWMFGRKESLMKLSNESLLSARKFVEKNGFIKFLESGVLVINPLGNEYDTHFIPFEFKNDNLYLSILLPNHFLNGEKQTAFKIEIKKDLKITNETGMVAASYNGKLVEDFFKGEIISYNNKMPCSLKNVFNEHPNVRPTGNNKVDTSQERLNLISAYYFPEVVYSDIIIILAANSYLVMQDKQVLVSKIEQKRNYSKSDKQHKKHKINPFYKYVVAIPADYKPRRFDVNYYVPDWTRSGFKTTRWVRKENAQILADRCGGKVTNEIKGDYRKIEIYIKPTHAYRKAGTPLLSAALPKTYSN